MEYSRSFKEAMVMKMMDPARRRRTEELAVEVGVHPSTLSRWVREAGRVGDMSRKKIKEKGGRPDDRTAEEKLQMVLEASLLTDEELGVFLREKGLHEAQLERWRQDALGGLSGQPPLSKSASGKTPEAKRIRELEKELNRKEKALAEAAALIVLKKKADALWGVEDNDTE